MPRGRDLSWAMKTAIWALRSKLGPKPEAILRDLEKLCQHDKPLEGETPPDSRTVTKVIDELQTLRLKVLATLPPHIWEIRTDYDEIHPELEQLARTGGITPSTFEQSDVRHDLEEAERELSLLKEKEPSLERQQTEHIKGLQEVARSFIDSIPKYPNSTSPDEFEAFYSSLSKLFRRLTGDARWPSLAMHLNRNAQELGIISRSLDPLIFTTRLEPIPESPYRQLVEEAWKLIPAVYVDLMVIAESADTREWAYYGLNPRCPSCPDQSYVEVDTSDPTAHLPGPFFILRIPQNTDVPESWRRLIQKQKGRRFTGPKIYLDYRQFLPHWRGG